MSKRIIVAGDICRDVALNCDASRLSPEGPWPVLTLHSVRENLGMAANVAANVATLAPDWVIVTCFPAEASVKTRYVDRKSNHHFLRVDQDVREPLDMKDWLRAVFAKPDAIILSDYNKGYLTTETMNYIATHFSARQPEQIMDQFCVPTFVDTKQLLSDWSRNITYVKLNESEYDAHIKAGVEPWRCCENLIVTRGADGMDLYDREGNVAYHSPGVKVEVADVAGAGDTVIAALAVKFLETGDIRVSMDYANKAAAVAVSKRGVVAVKREEIL